MSDGHVPQFPGKGGTPAPAGKPGPTQEQPGWKKAVCPFLTAGEIARKPIASVIAVAGVQPSEAVKAQPCLGPQCMLFIGVKMPDGSEAAGCAPVHQFAQLNTLNQQVAMFIAAAKAGAEAEAAASVANLTPPIATDAVPTPIKTE